MKRKIMAFGICLALIISCSLLPATVGATELAPFIDLQERGLTLATAGVGLQGWDGTPRNLTVTVGGTVRFALLYWNGSTVCETNANPCPFSQPFKDQQIIFNGNPITGTVIGTETQTFMSGNPKLHIGYFADATSIVASAGTGTHSFTFADGNGASNLDQLNGASLVVAYTDASNPNFYRVLVWDGLDFAQASSFAAGDNRVTAPVNFNHGATASARQGELYIINGGSTASLPDTVTVSNNPTIANSLDASSGNLWDNDKHSINIPANAGTTTVQLNSILTAAAAPSACGHGYWKNHPEAWAGTGYSPNQTVGSVFSGANMFPSLASQTLMQALKNGGGSGTLGAAKILLRSAVAALLNSAKPGLNYPRTTAMVISDVNAALTSNNRTTMLNLAEELDEDNNLPCVFNATSGQTSDSILWEVAMLRVQVGDVIQPSCSVTLNDPGPPARIQITFQDTESGLASIEVTLSENADTVVPPFTVGTTDPVVVSSTKIDQTQAAKVEARATDLAGNQKLCTFDF
jgi:hypothetical protein